jgi:hypothetical protein
MQRHATHVSTAKDSNATTDAVFSIQSVERLYNKDQ